MATVICLLQLKLDTDNSVEEIYEDNNNFNSPFYVKKDATATSVTEAYSYCNI